MIGDSPQPGLFWKEWQARRGVLISVCVLLLAPALLAMGESDFFSMLLWCIPLSSALLGLTLFFSDEQDPARSFVYLLPISRRRIVATKLLALFSQWLVLALVGSLLVSLAAVRLGEQHRPQFPDFDFLLNDWSQPLLLLSSLMAGLMGTLVAGIFSLHLRSVITAGALAAGCLFILGAITVAASYSGFKQMPQFSPWPYWLFIGRCLLLTALLVAWLFFLFTKTTLLEQGPSARMFLALLFGAALIELAATLFFANWREVVFTVTGM